MRIADKPHIEHRTSPIVAALGLATAILALALGAFAQEAMASPGAFDPTFGSGGFAINQFAPPGGLSLATDVALAPEGKIVVAGGTEEPEADKVMVARYLPDGSLDPSFGSGGAVTLQIGKGAKPASVVEFSGLAVMPDGRIVLAGTATEGEGDRAAFVARLLPEGKLDASFAGGYVVQQLGEKPTPPETPFSEFIGLALEPEGKIVVTGTAVNSADQDELVVERFDTNGSPDGSFGKGGLYRQQLGTGSAERYPSSVGADVIRQSDGSLLVAGGATDSSTSEAFLLLKLTPNGEPNLGFGSGGATVFQPSAYPGPSTAAYRLAEQPGGKIVLAGGASFDEHHHSAFALARFDSDGSVDRSFGTGGATLTQLSSAPEPTSEGVGLAIQADGKIVMSGLVYADEESNFIFTVARYTADGALDQSFAQDGVLQRQLSTESPGSSVATADTIDEEGKLLSVGAVGATNSSLASLLTRIELDTPPSVSFTYPSEGCSPTPSSLTFSANISDNEDPITAVQWEFAGNGEFAGGDASTVTVSPSAITAPGGKVSVRVTNADGLTSTATEPPPAIPPCAPPPPPPPNEQPTHASLSFTAKTLTMNGNGELPLELTATGALSGKATLTTLVSSKAKGHSKHRKTTTRKVTLGSGQIVFDAAGKSTLTLHLSPSAQAMVRKVTTLKGTLTLVATVGSSSQTTTVSVVVRSKLRSHPAKQGFGKHSK